MSTRGVVAVGTLQHWRGVYNHSDSYPTGLGETLYKHLTRVLLHGKTLAELGEDILRFDDWCNYLKGGVCEYCGQMTGQPHSIIGGLFGKHRRKYPDPQAKYHEHNSLDNLPALQYTNDDVADSDLEWVYVINPAAARVHVLSLGERKKHVGDMRFDAIPDFGNLECGEDLERCHHYARHHFPEIDPNGPQHRLGTRHYLGLLPMRDLNNAFAFECNGIRYQRGGSGVHGAYARHLGICAPEPDAWYEAVVGEDQQRSYLPVAYIGRQGYRPYTGVTWIFPPTRVNPSESVRAR